LKRGGTRAAVLMDTFIDYYAVLEVDRNASPTEIKAAFKKLALRYHPDVYKAGDANERMSQILQAYHILSDQAERKLYDSQRARHGGEESTFRTTSSMYTGQKQKSGVSAGARRDRQRHYAFPQVRPGQSLIVDLVDISYTLSPAEGQQLMQSGLLRGVAPLTKDGVYYCHRCHTHWEPIVDHEKKASAPRSCPKCMAPDWAEYLLLRCTHCHAVFESEQIRYAIGAYMYGKSDAVRKTGLCPPYELFPLCPYCGKAHWCPSEEDRVHELGIQAARRAAIVRTVVIVGSIAALLIIGMFALIH
jgi:DnaJ domain